MWRVVTDLAIMGFDEDTREMKVLALHPGVTREQVQDNTGFELLFDRSRNYRAAARTSSTCCASSTRAALYGVARVGESSASVESRCPSPALSARDEQEYLETAVTMAKKKQTVFGIAMRNFTKPTRRCPTRRR